MTIFQIEYERPTLESLRQRQFRRGRRQCEELFSRASLLRNTQDSWVVSRPFGAGGHEMSVVPFYLSVGWASVAPNCKRIGSLWADGCVQPGAKSS